MTPLNNDTPPREGPRRNWYQRKRGLSAWRPTGHLSGRPANVRRRLFLLLKRRPFTTLAEAQAEGHSERSYYRVKAQIKKVMEAKRARLPAFTAKIPVSIG